MDARSLAREGLWTNNAALVQLLGLCPLLAVSTSTVTSLGLGLTTLVVLTASNITVSLLRGLLADSTRIPTQILVIATFVTLADLVLQALVFDIHQRIGLFVALIVTNCTLLGRAESFASRFPVRMAAIDGFMMGVGFLVVLITMGTCRELVGHGTLLANMQLLFGPGAEAWEIRIMDGGFLLALLPPGAFFTLGLLIAARNWIELRQTGKHEQGKAHPDIVATSR